MPRDDVGGEHVARTVRTTCPYCGVGCGVVADVDGDTVSVRGDPDHPANHGRLCSKGAALAETLEDEGRLLHPEIGGRRAGWSEALDLVARRFAETIAAYGPESVALYVSGQLLTEDYYVANKLMKGAIGSANIDTNSRLCMASTVAGHRRAFGSDTVPGQYEDLELADLVILVGSNLAWCHPVLFQRLAAARERRPEMRVVVIDPRRTATVEAADLHLALAPDSDVALFAGLLRHLDAAGALDRRFADAHTTGLEAALAAASGLDVRTVAALTGLAGPDVARFYEMVAATERTVTVFSQGVNQSARGTDKVSAILNVHLATGRIGRPGTGPFSVTGQPNAMGGREVGGLANQLAAHLDIESPGHRALLARFWNVDRVPDRPGLKAVELFDAVADGRIRALWIMATNPVDSLPDADRIRAALLACPFVVVSDVARDTDTTRCADVLLPAAAWGEKDGTVTNSERRLSRQRAFRAPPGEAKPDWWIVAQVARRLGDPAAFDYAGPAAVFRDHARLSAAGNGGERDFDIGGLADIDDRSYDALTPTTWPLRRGNGPVRRLFADGRFYTPDGRARLVPTPAGSLASGSDDALVLNTGRLRDHWHTMTRTGRSPRLSAHVAEPFVAVHPEDAARLGLSEAGLARLESPHGTMTARVLVTGDERPGSVFVPIHWTDQHASEGRVGALVAPRTDPVSGQPASKGGRVRVRPVTAAWFAFSVSAGRPAVSGVAYWALARCPGGWRSELAGTSPLDDPAGFAVALLAAGDGAEVLTFHDTARGRFRVAAFRDDILAGAVFLAPGPVDVSRAWAVRQLGTAHSGGGRLAVLSGRAGDPAADPGAIVCACFQVGRNPIAAAIRDRACGTVDQIGRLLHAGTGCGSCRSELQRMLTDARFDAAV